MRFHDETNCQLYQNNINAFLWIFDRDIEKLAITLNSRIAQKIEVLSPEKLDFCLINKRNRFWNFACALIIN
jgi:hypothetical protein